MSKRFVNLSSKICNQDIITQTDLVVAQELNEAGIITIPNIFNPDNSKVRTTIIGSYYGWVFDREETCYVARGPAIPIDIAMGLHRIVGNELRVAGYPGHVSPIEYYGKFGVSSYDVDSQEALNALTKAISDLAHGGPIQKDGSRKLN